MRVQTFLSFLARYSRAIKRATCEASPQSNQGASGSRTQTRANAARRPSALRIPKLGVHPLPIWMRSIRASCAAQQPEHQRQRSQVKQKPDHRLNPRQSARFGVVPHARHDYRLRNGVRVIAKLLSSPSIFGRRRNAGAGRAGLLPLPKRASIADVLSRAASTLSTRSFSSS